MGLGQMKMEIICDGEIINQHSDARNSYYGGWNNPLYVLPPIGSTIEYMTFNQRQYKDKGILTEYVVRHISFYTEEDSNHMYRRQACRIMVDRLEG